MDLTPYVDRLRAELSSAASLGGDDVVATADRLAGALDHAARLAMLELLSDAAAEITALVPSGSVEVRMRGRDPELVLDLPAVGEGDGGDYAAPSAVGSDEDEDGDVIRLTLRLPEGLKARVEELAQGSGRSLNNWLVGAVRGAAEPGATSHSSGSRRLTGWV